MGHGDLVRVAAALTARRQRIAAADAADGARLTAGRRLCAADAAASAAEHAAAARRRAEGHWREQRVGRQPTGAPAGPKDDGVGAGSGARVCERARVGVGVYGHVKRVEDGRRARREM